MCRTAEFLRRGPRAGPIQSGCQLCGFWVLTGACLRIGDVDIVDGTPLLDIKPYIPDFDVRTNARAGWYDTARNRLQTVADRRFMHKKKN